LNLHKIGLKITAIVLVKLDAKYIVESSKLAAFKETHHLFQSTGEYDLISVVHARDMLHLNKLMKKIKLLPGVRDTLVSVATNLIKVEPQFYLRF
jgi:DNA-binding Lrp family transcriptional regulator